VADAAVVAGAVGLELPPQAEANRISVMADTKVRMASVCHPTP